MARLYDPIGNDARLEAPATERNRDVIYSVLKDILPAHGTVLEVASGTGEHAVFLSPHFPNLDWQPTDIDADHLRSIEAWRTTSNINTILPAQPFNILDNAIDAFEFKKPLCAIAAINLIHISPWLVAEALFQKAGVALPRGGILYLYGPYKRGGAQTAPSNEQFELWLKARDPAFGVRDMEAVIDLGNQNGFSAPAVTPMPANNFSLVFQKT